MYFELKGKTYRIKFFRDGTSTIAELHQIGEDGKMISLGVYGVARLSAMDRFVKSIGRKVALAHLLFSQSDHYDKKGNFVESMGPLVLTKEHRELIWNKYFETHKR